MNLLEINRRIRQRPPFQMIERVTALEPGKSAEGVKCVSVNEPYFQGHMPGLPIMPGVLLIESAAQLCSLVIEEDGGEKVYVLLKVKDFKFLKPVIPGDRLELHAELLRGGAIDLALAALESTGANLAYELIEKENIGILAGKEAGIAKRNLSGTPLTVDAAKGDSFVYLTKGHSARVIQDKLFRKSGFAPHVLLETDSLEVGRRVAVEAGACIILSDSLYCFNSSNEPTFSIKMVNSLSICEAAYISFSTRPLS